MKKKPMLMFFAVLTLYSVAASFAHPVTPSLIVERHLDSSLFGTALASMMTMNFLLSPFWGKFCSYVPTRKIMLFCCFGYSIGQAIFGAATSGAMVIGGRMFAGVFTGGMYVSFANYVVNTSSPESRGANLTASATIQTVASAVGYFIGGMLGMISVEAAFIAQVAILVLCGVLFYLLCMDDTPFKVRPDKPIALRDVNPFSAFASAKTFMTGMLALIFITVALSGVAYNSYEQCFNYYIKDQFGMGSQYNGTFKAVIAGAIMLVNSTVCIYLQKKTDINKTFLPVIALCALDLAAVLTLNSQGIFIGGYILFHVIYGVRTPMLQNMVASRATPENSNLVMGFNQSMNSLGSIFGALFAGLIYSANPRYPFMLALAAMTVSALTGAMYVSKYKKEKKA